MSVDVSTIFDITNTYINLQNEAEEKKKDESKKTRKGNQSDIDAFFR